MSDYHFEFEKQPREEATRGVDFARRYEFKHGDYIVGDPLIEITYNGQPVTDMLVASSVENNSKVLFRVRGGDHGKNYKISILVTTNQGHKREADILMKVREK